jgi:uncharacterized protein
METMKREQLLVAIAITALALWLLAHLLLLIDGVNQVPITVSWPDLGIGIGFGLGVTALSKAIYHLWPAYRRSADFYLSFVLEPLLIVDTIWLGLLPGMSEELLFRGVLLPAVGLNLIGVIITSLCFGILHLSGAQQWPYVVWAMIIGLLFGLSTLWSGNLLIPIVAHVTTNFVSSLVWKLQARSPSNP